MNSTQETAEIYKEKYNKLKKESSRNGEDRGAPTYLDHARSALASQQQRVNSTLEEDDKYGYSSIRPNASRAGSQVSLGSGLANHARSIVGSFACAGGNKRSGGVVAQELAENRDAEIREMAFRRSSSGVRDRDRRRANDKRNSGQSMSLSSSFSSETQSQSTAPHRRTPHSVASGSTRSKSSRSFREVRFSFDVHRLLVSLSSSNMTLLSSVFAFATTSRLLEDTACWCHTYPGKIVI